MYQSWFSYNLSRPYPFRWFTPLVIVGGVLFTILFSVVNLATNGYYLKTIYTTDPNGTIAEKHWYTSPPWSWGDKIQATCQPQEIPVGYQFFTTNSGLSYTLESVSQYDASSNETIPFASLPYLNQTLQDCQINEIVIDMKKSDESDNGWSNQYSWTDSSAAATANCIIDTSVGLVNVTFSTKYQAQPKDYTYTIKNNYTSAASMWWGTRLLNLYWYSTVAEMGDALFPTNVNGSYTTVWTRGQMTFSPNITTDIKTYDYFNLTYWFLADANIVTNLDLAADESQGIMYYPGPLFNNDEQPCSGALTEGLTWSKIMSSMILTDLGDSGSQNVLQDPNLLQWALQYPDDTYRKQLELKACYICSACCDYSWPNYFAIAPPTLPPDSGTQINMNQSYNEFKDQMGPLGTQKAQIYLQYACSVPDRKDTASLILTILISDIVFLSTLWSILTWVAGQFVKRQNEMAMACEAHAEDLEYGLVGQGMSKIGDSASETTSGETLGRHDGVGNGNSSGANEHVPVR